MRSPRAVMLIAVLAGGLASACHRSLDSSDAQTASKDADANLDAASEPSGDHPSACYPLFHACTTTDECCAPNRCLNITGTPACQQEGPALDADSSEPDRMWQFAAATHVHELRPRAAGRPESKPCLCDGIRACHAVAGGAFSRTRQSGKRGLRDRR